MTKCFMCSSDGVFFLYSNSEVTICSECYCTKLLDAEEREQFTPDKLACDKMIGRL